MVAIAAGLIGFVGGFAAAFAGWRWGLGNRNWTEGGVVALITGGVCGAVAHTLVRAATIAGRG